jgi:dTMP kinase
MDLALSPDPIQSFRMFQSKVLDEYDRIADEFGLTVSDGKRSVVEQQREARRLVRPLLKGLRRTGLPRPVLTRAEAAS